MYPTTLFGLILIAAAVAYARNPDARRALVCRNLSILTLLAGILGFVTGVINSFTAASQLPGELGAAVVAGVGESLNNVGVALVAMTIATIVKTIGSTRTNPSELTDPHAH
jgi:hypothetical protein